MDDIAILFANLPKYGWGLAKEIDNIEQVHEQLKDIADMEIVLGRANYLKKFEDQKKEVEWYDLLEWLKIVKESDSLEESFLKWLLENFTLYEDSINNGLEFDIRMDWEVLSQIAEKFLYFKN